MRRVHQVLPFVTLMAGIEAVTGLDAARLGRQPVFRAGIDLVTFGVTVVDKRGELVTDLTQDDFEIVEEGKPQNIQYFARGDDANEASQTHLGLMLDTSCSM